MSALQAAELPDPSDSRAALAGRGTFHLLFRCAARAMAFLAVADRRDSTRCRVGIAAFGLFDLAGYTFLRRSTRFMAGPRLAADTVDVALWSEVLGAPYDIAVMPGVPLAAEAGLRSGLLALAVPATEATAIAVWRHHRKVPGGLRAFSWQVMAVVGGWGLHAYERRLARDSTDRMDREVSARATQAYMAGQASVALGADTVVDRLWSLGVLVGADPAGVDVLRAWRNTLGERISENSIYLGDALLRWERHHNDRPSFDLDVEVHVPAGDGTTIFSAPQALALVSTLDGMELVGRVDVSVVDRAEAALPGGRRRLAVNDEIVVLDADRSPRLTPLDAGPAALVLGAVWQLQLASDSFGGAPLAAVMPWSAMSVLLSGWAHRRLPLGDQRTRFAILVGSLGISTLYAAAVTPRLRRPFGPHGQQRYPFLDTGTASAVLAGLYHQDLTRGQKIACVVAGGALVSVGISTLSGPIRWPQLGVEILWLVAAATPASRLSATYNLLANDLERNRAEADRRQVVDAFREGRSDVIKMVTVTVDALAGAIESSAVISTDLRRVAADRIAEVRQRIEALESQL